MAKYDDGIVPYLREVANVLKSSGCPKDEASFTLISLREHIDDAISAGGTPDQILAELDPPAAFGLGWQDRSQLDGSALAILGFLCGVAMFVTGFLFVPVLAPEMRTDFGNPLILFSALWLVCGGLATRPSRYGYFSLALGSAIGALILATALIL
ncbi:MAG: hypothetical protein AAGH57_13860 [Pseudomonadota bacterium]